MQTRHLSCKRGLLLILLLGTLAGPQGLTAVAGPHGTLDLVADRVSIQPGKPFRVGLYFRLDKGWHIYWVNPGDSGEPPRIKWELPPGFQAGPLQWPAPLRIEDHSLVDYGYQDEVLLPVEIKPAASSSPAPEARLSAVVNWLVCREICVPGHATLALTLPLREGSPGPPSPAHALFVKAQADLPRPAPSTWKISTGLDQHRFVLTIVNGKGVARAVFFPLTPNQIENATPQKVTPAAGGVRLELAKSDQLLKAPAHLAGVLVMASGKSYNIDVPVVTAK